jgi:quinoprotein glucose dehydrogenase
MTSLLDKSKIAAGVLFFLTICFCSCTSEETHNGWESYKGSPEGIHYSSLTEVDTSNVSQLNVAWEYHTGDADTVAHSQMQCNPIIVNGILYGTSPQLKLFALDAATGTEKWVFNPAQPVGDNQFLHFILNNNRGVTYWSDGNSDKRIYYATGPKLYAINAETGMPVQSFGKNGSIDLHDGLDRPNIADLYVTATSPPVIFNDILITGTRVDEGALSAPGHIRGYDVRTGKQKWIFHTIPYPGEPGYETWDDKDAYKFIGGANAWSGLTLDLKKGIVFAATGSASYDFYGGKRTGANLYANCLLALDATTGKRIWHFQVIHHDVWDRDLSSPPALVSINKNGNNVEAVALTTKTGFIFVFERTTGKSLFEINEISVPTETDLIGEKLSPTQPYPSLPAPFMRQKIDSNELNTFLPDSSIIDLRKRLAAAKHNHMYNPITLKGVIEFPGLDGGAEWGGPTYDPETNLLYVNANEIPWELQAIRIEPKPTKTETTGQAGIRLFQANCMACHGADRKGSGNFPSIVDAAARYNHSTADELIRLGRRMMPAFAQLSVEERNAIISYILDDKQRKAKPYTGPSLPLDSHYRMPYSVKGYNKFLSLEKYPAIKPPWGTISAVNLATGAYAWQKPLGNDSTVRGNTEPTGIENYGASVVTKGGLLFIAATKDGRFRAFNKRTGKLLWEFRLPVPAFATPAVYQLSGKQYIVIACGGGKSGLKSGDSYIAFALP